MSDTTSCPICRKPGHLFFTEAITAKVYYRCPICEMIWMDQRFRINSAQEKSHYNLHENDPADQTYRQFLSQLWLPLKDRIQPKTKGLDYGSGPGPTLHLMAEEDGFKCRHYDPYFHPESKVLQENYDFITCSETAEHFYEPYQEFHKLAHLLKDGGWLGIMTSRYKDSIVFKNWHYRHDPTHVTFYTDKTFEVIADLLHFDSIILPSKRIALLRKGVNV